MSYESYFNQLKRNFENKDADLNEILSFSLQLYDQAGFYLRNHAIRAVDKKFISLLINSKLADDDLIQAIEAYLIGAHSTIGCINLFQDAQLIDKDELKIQLREQCQFALCDHPMDAHFFSKGATDNSNLEEALIAGINVYQAMKAEVRVKQLSDAHHNALYNMVISLTNDDMNNVLGAHPLDDKTLSSLIHSIGNKTLFDQALRNTSPGFIKRFNEIFEDVKSGRMPISGTVDLLDVAYSDQAIVKMCLYNLSVRYRLGVSSKLWHWYNTNQLSSNILQLFESYTRSSYPECFDEMSQMLKDYLTKRHRKLHLRKLGHHTISQDIIIALHGWLDCCDTWYPLARDAEIHGMSVIAYDQFGFGRDDDRKHNQLDVGKMLLDIESVIAYVKAISPGARIHLVGHSMGGALISQLALYSNRQRDVSSFHAITPAILNGAQDLLNIAKVRRKVDYQEVLLRLSRSPGIMNVTGEEQSAIDAVKQLLYSAADFMVSAIGTFKPLTDLMISTFEVLGELMETTDTCVEIYVGNQDFCVNSEAFQSLIDTHPNCKNSAMHFRFFKNAYHLPSQSRNKEFFNGQILNHIEAIAHPKL